MGVSRNVLVVGTGNREDAIAWHLLRCGHRVFAGLYNRNIMGDLELAGIDYTQPVGLRRLVAYAAANDVSHVVVGPETALAAGVPDALRSAGLSVLGPDREAAQLETSKVFAKALLARAGIPSADYRLFQASSDAKRYCRERGLQSEEPAARDVGAVRLVVKADGLAGGKGAVVCGSLQEAHAAIEDMLDHRRFGHAGSTILIEDFLDGPEFSVNGLLDSTSDTWKWLPSQQDHKTVGDGGVGPNTGGMGTYRLEQGRRPIPNILQLQRTLEQTFVGPLLRQLDLDDIRYRGPVCANLVLTERGPSVLEINARFGDPEAAIIMLQLTTDIVDLIDSMESGRLSQLLVGSSPESAVCISIAASGYPGIATTGDPVRLPPTIPAEAMIFQGGATLDDLGTLVTRAGRVLVVAASGRTLEMAHSLAYRIAGGIHFQGMHFRTDIAGIAVDSRF